MRISTTQIFNISNIGMRDAQYELNKTSEQISTGKRVLSPADDPVAATSILALNQELSRITQFNKNIDSADNNLSLEDTTLQSIVNLVQRLKELSTQAGNTAVLTPSDYKAISAEVDSRTDELMNLLNTRNASGQYIFSGFQSETQPFANLGDGKFQYNGDEGQLRVQSSTSVTVAVSDSGKKIFVDIPSSHNTFNTSVAETNRANPPATISVGDVVDQAQFDQLYPEDLEVVFNANSAVVPPSPNYMVRERGTGKILLDKQVYVSGKDIEVAGARFSIQGSPYPGLAATPATIPMNSAAFAAGPATDFSSTTGKFDITVGGITETLYLDTNITTNVGADSLNNLVTALGGGDPTFYQIPINANTNAALNYQKLKNLGITVTKDGFSSATGLNITIKNGNLTGASTPNVDTTLSVSTAIAGTTSTDGVLAKEGDKFLLQSTDKQGLMTTVARFSDAMKKVDNTQASKDTLAKIIAKTLKNFENVITTIASTQGDVGARQNMLETSKNLNADIELSSKEVLSQVQDLDYAEASTRLQMQTMVLSASQQSFIRVSELSLFKYM